VTAAYAESQRQRVEQRRARVLEFVGGRSWDRLADLIFDLSQDEAFASLVVRRGKAAANESVSGAARRDVPVLVQRGLLERHPWRRVHRALTHATDSG
jgi:hypothetical protein